MVLGMFETAPYAAGRRPSSARGDTLLVFSDGVTETWSADDEEFGEERLRERAAAAARLRRRRPAGGDPAELEASRRAQGHRRPHPDRPQARETAQSPRWQGPQGPPHPAARPPGRAPPGAPRGDTSAARGRRPARRRMGRGPRRPPAASTPTPHASGPGSGSSRPRGPTERQPPARHAAIISMKQSSSARSAPRRWLPASPSR